MTPILPNPQIRWRCDAAFRRGALGDERLFRWAVDSRNPRSFLVHFVRNEA